MFRALHRLHYKQATSQVLEHQKDVVGVLLAELKVCSKSKNLSRGKAIHARAIESGVQSSIYVASALINMYAKCGSMAEARQVFDTVKNPSVVSWTALILGYAENGEGSVALNLFSKMKTEGCAPNSVTYIAALKACSSLYPKQDSSRKAECLALGKRLHSEIGCHSNPFLQSTLVDMYAKCGCMVSARRVFDGIKERNVVLWTTLILGYVENGEEITALGLFEVMRSEGCLPNSMTFVAVLKACGSLAEQNEQRRAECLERGKRIHSQTSSCLDKFVQSALIDMYAKCGSMEDAREVFEGIRQPDLVAWNVLLSGYARNGEGPTALDLLERMISRGCSPDCITFVAALKACIALALKHNDQAGCLQRGRQIHSRITCSLDAYLQNTLMDMYSKSGSMADARQVFDDMKLRDVGSWNVLISGYAENGEPTVSLELFGMMKSQGFAPDCMTFVAVLKACASLAVERDDSGRAECLELGKLIHSEMKCLPELRVLNTLIDMYAKCGSMSDALQVFDGISHPDVVSWNVLMLGYVENGESSTALNMFARMKSQGFVPDCVTFLAALKACGLLGALDSGSRIHAEIDTGTIERNAVLLTCLVDFYAKCGNMVEAQRVFDSHSATKDLRTWTALLAGYTRVSNDKAALGLFERMQDAGLKPDGITFLSILTCCSHAGLVERATELFVSMSSKYGIAPSLEHYNCMVDILGRMNKLEDALALLRSMPCGPDAVTWMTMLGACHKWKLVGTGKLAFESLLSLGHFDATIYVLMAHIYASRGMRIEQEMVLQLREKCKAPKMKLLDEF